MFRRCLSLWQSGLEQTFWAGLYLVGIKDSKQISQVFTTVPPEGCRNCDSGLIFSSSITLYMFYGYA